jgi:hypothetical protein
LLSDDANILFLALLTRYKCALQVMASNADSDSGGEGGGFVDEVLLKVGGTHDLHAYFSTVHLTLSNIAGHGIVYQHK